MHNSSGLLRLTLAMPIAAAATSAPAGRERHAAAIGRGLTRSPAGDAPRLLALVVALVVPEVPAWGRIRAAGTVAAARGLFGGLEVGLATAGTAPGLAGEFGKLRGLRHRRIRDRRGD